MPKVSVLYIADEVIGPHLELLRNICEPQSKSRPHVTVRYFDRLPVPAQHLSVAIHSVDLVDPGSFGFESGTKHNHIVFIRCESEDLLHLEHKPNFPASELHITIYDGPSQEFAISLLSLLRRFRWGVRLRLPNQTFLSEIEIRKKKSGSSLPSSRIYAHDLKQLFFASTGKYLAWDAVLKYSPQERLELVEKICVHLDLCLRDTVRIPRIQNESPDAIAFAGNDVDTEVHLTPPELAQAIAHCALAFMDSSQGIHFGDPAVGTGAFYAALLQEVRASEVLSAIGVDINPQQVKAARQRWHDKGMEVILGDYLHMEQLAPRNLVLANPPYLRHQAIPADYKSELRQRASVKMGMKISGLSGQYVYFLLLTHEWMASEAIAAWLIPSEFMQTTYGQAVRRYLVDRVQLLRIHQFGHDDPQFESAEVLPAVVIFRNSAPHRSGFVEMTSGGTLATPRVSEKVQLKDFDPLVKWSIPWRPPSADRFVGTRLGDLFTVKRGIATGANKFFIIDRHTAKKMGLPDEVLRPVFPKVRQLENDVVEGCKDGFPDVHPQLCLLDCALPIDEIKKRYPKLFDYLRSGEESEIFKRTLLRSRFPWYKQEWRPVAKFLCTYMGRTSGDRAAIRFIWNKSEAVATNTYLMLYPHAPLAELLKEQPGLEVILFKALQAAAHESVFNLTRIHAGGLHKVEPRELLEARLTVLPRVIRETAQRHLI